MVKLPKFEVFVSGLVRNLWLRPRTHVCPPGRPSPPVAKKKKTKQKKLPPLSLDNAAQLRPRLYASCARSTLKNSGGGVLFDFFALLLGFFFLRGLFVSRNAAVFSFDRARATEPDAHSGLVSLLHVERCHGGGMRCWAAGDGLSAPGREGFCRRLARFRRI